MFAKTSPSIICRFTGRNGKKRLIECLSQQPLIMGNESIAAALLKTGKLIEFEQGDEIIKQGNADNDVYLIIAGAVSISVNGREIASREANTHFGEMSLIDLTTTRAATVSTKEKSICLRVTESDFSSIANENPELWRRLAVTLSSRLRERNKFHSQPHIQPVIFIGSSSEALDAARAINSALLKKPVVTKIWTKGIFEASKTTIEDLLRIAGDSDFAIIVLSPDDVYVSRGKKKSVPRDNAVFELGLFMGALGRERAFIVTPKDNDLKIPTDLLGVTCLRFKMDGPETLGRKLQPVCKELYRLINNLGPR